MWPAIQSTPTSTTLQKTCWKCLPIPTTLQGTVRDPQSNEALTTHVDIKTLPWLKNLHKGLSTVLPCTVWRNDPILLVPFYHLFLCLTSLIGIILFAGPKNIQNSTTTQRTRKLPPPALHIYRMISVMTQGNYGQIKAEYLRKNVWSWSICALRAQVSNV